MSPRERLATARLYLVCDARPRDVLAAALRGGVDLVQLRDKTLDDDGLVAAARAFRAAPTTRRAVHPQRPARPRRGVRRRRRPRRPGRRAAGRRRARRSAPDRIVGRSTHAPEQAAAADADPDVDYLAVGPVHATPTKPGRPAAGLDYVALRGAHGGASRGSRSAASTRATSHEVVERGATPDRRRARDHRGRRPRGRRARAARARWRAPLGQRSRKRRPATDERDARDGAAATPAARERDERDPRATLEPLAPGERPRRGHGRRDRRGRARACSTSCCLAAGRRGRRQDRPRRRAGLRVGHARRRGRDVAVRYWAVLGFQVAARHRDRVRRRVADGRRATSQGVALAS